jgi:hypothetical protein
MILHRQTEGGEIAETGLRKQVEGSEEASHSVFLDDRGS